MSSITNKLRLAIALPFLACALPPFAVKAAIAQPNSPPQGRAKPRPESAPDPEQLFHQGEQALKAGKLDEAERSFRGVLRIDPQVAGAYANLGVIYMRRKQWPHALEELHRAEKLAPQLAGIRLNIGLTYYRKGDYRAAIGPFESVVQDVPSSNQARQLLGLCYFFTERYGDAVTTLEPIWGQASDQLNYLYVLGISANKIGNKDLEDRALTRLVETGQNSAEFHLLMGKAHINREEYDEAITELQQAEKSDSKLPFLHYNLGTAYLKKHDLVRAKQEFLKDVAIEPDVAYNYDQLGQVEFLQLHDEPAEKNLLLAIKLDPALATAHSELARVYQRQAKYGMALAEAETAQKLQPDNYTLHYIRGQLLHKLGRGQEAQTEMKTYTTMMNDLRGKRQKELEAGALPNPELTKEPE